MSVVVLGGLVSIAVTDLLITPAIYHRFGSAEDATPFGDELFDVMCQLEETMPTQSFFVMDENFLLHKKRAMELLKRMQEHNKAWTLYVFSSANAIRNSMLRTR